MNTPATHDLHGKLKTWIREAVHTHALASVSNVLSKVVACCSLSIAEATAVVAPLKVSVDVQCAEELFGIAG